MEKACSAEQIRRPRKGDFRQRAHCNPLSDAYIEYPASTEFVDWSLHYPHHYGGRHDLNADKILFLNTAQHPIDYSVRPEPGREKQLVDFLDVGCGYGGMLFALAVEYPEKRALGMEIREKLTIFVGEKIRAMRTEEQSSHQYQNVSVVRTNAMKFLPNYIGKNQLEKIFFNFPDPHFKRANWRRRIVTPQLLSLYAYHLKQDGVLYFVTDVSDLFGWMISCANKHPLFERVPQKIADEDKAYQAMKTVTEEGKKAMRNGETIYAAMYRCVKPFDRYF